MGIGGKAGGSALDVLGGHAMLRHRFMHHALVASNWLISSENGINVIYSYPVTRVYRIVVDL